MRKGRITVSLPREIITEIDSERGDVPRSRFVWKILARALEGKVGNA